MLGLGVLVVVGNTIRLEIQNRRDEIEVTKLVGGSDAFVRRPFLYTGFCYGLGGGVHRLGDHPGRHRRPARAHRPAGRPLRQQLSSSGPWVLRPRPSCSLAAVALGWLGSYIAATRHLREIEPT